MLLNKKRLKSSNYLKIIGARENNLKNIDVKFPLNELTVITGVSGSGKSTLMKDILTPAIQRNFEIFGNKIGDFDDLVGDIQQLEGIGFLGFQKTYASDAYESELINGKYRIKTPFNAVFWNIQTRNPLMENTIEISKYGGIKNFFTINTVTNDCNEINDGEYTSWKSNKWFLYK